jgi:putative PIN family toxin of toxin-antitoxin system
VRVVLDVNVLIASLLSRDGAPARLVLRWLAGEFELIISAKVVAELRRALSYPKVRARVSQAEAEAFVHLLESSATSLSDPSTSPRRSRDEADDYLLELAARGSAIVVSGDGDLLALRRDFPIYSPSEFLDTLHDR